MPRTRTYPVLGIQNGEVVVVRDLTFSVLKLLGQAGNSFGKVHCVAVQDLHLFQSVDLDTTAVSCNRYGYLVQCPVVCVAVRSILGSSLHLLVFVGRIGWGHTRGRSTKGLFLVIVRTT